MSSNSNDLDEKALGLTMTHLGINVEDILGPDGEYDDCNVLDVPDGYFRAAANDAVADCIHSANVEGCSHVARRHVEFSHAVRRGWLNLARD